MRPRATNIAVLLAVFSAVACAPESFDETERLHVSELGSSSYPLAEGAEFDIHVSVPHPWSDEHPEVRIARFETTPPGLIEQVDPVPKELSHQHTVTMRALSAGQGEIRAYVHTEGGRGLVSTSGVVVDEVASVTVRDPCRDPSGQPAPRLYGAPGTINLEMGLKGVSDRPLYGTWFPYFRIEREGVEEAVTFDAWPSSLHIEPSGAGVVSVAAEQFGVDLRVPVFERSEVTAMEAGAAPEDATGTFRVRPHLIVDGRVVCAEPGTYSVAGRIETPETCEFWPAEDADEPVLAVRSQGFDVWARGAGQCEVSFAFDRGDGLPDLETTFATQVSP